MTTVRERVLQEQQRAFKPLLFEVWIECGSMGIPGLPIEWELNSTPKPLRDALEEAVECREWGYPTRVLPHIENGITA
jgi:hypothetical protein